MGDGNEALYDNAAIIAHPHEPRLLLLTSEAGWTLPRFGATEPPAIIHVIRERLGVDTIVLRREYDRARVEPEARQQIYALETRSPDWTPPENARWVGRHEFYTLPLANPEVRLLLDAWLAEAEGETLPPQRAPWEHAGWFAAAAAWLRERAEEAGYALTGPVEQAHLRLWSCMLTAPTDRGPLYMKAVEPAFAFEAPLTRALAQRWPRHLPPVVAIDAARGWLLTAHGGQVLRDLVRREDGIDHWERLLAQFAQMQIESAGAAEHLIALGAPDRRLARIPQLYQEIVADRETLLVGQPGGLSEADWARAGVQIRGGGALRGAGGVWRPRRSAPRRLRPWQCAAQSHRRLSRLRLVRLRRHHATLLALHPAALGALRAPLRRGGAGAHARRLSGAVARSHLQ